MYAVSIGCSLFGVVVWVLGSVDGRIVFYEIQDNRLGLRVVCCGGGDTFGEAWRGRHGYVGV